MYVTQPPASRQRLLHILFFNEQETVVRNFNDHLVTEIMHDGTI